MNGREEREAKIYIKIEEWLKDKPKYYNEFYKSITNKTADTKMVYLRNVHRFIIYMGENYDFNINNKQWTKKVKPSMVGEYMNQLSGENTTKAAQFYSIKYFFKYLLVDDIIKYNPCDNIEAPRDNKEHEIVYLTTDEIKILEDNIKSLRYDFTKSLERRELVDRDYAIIMILIYLGLRISSLVELNIDDVDLDNNTIQITEKGGKSRKIVFPNRIRDIIINYLHYRERFVNINKIKSNALFFTHRGERITRKAVDDVLQMSTKGINKRITPHKLRSTCATAVYAATGDIYSTMDVLGHKNINNTRRYASISREKKIETMNALDDYLNKS